MRALDVGQLIAGRFRLVRPLGKGGMGVVWLATDESLGEEVAFKFLSEIIAHDEASLHDLKRELRRTRALTHHHIIRVHDLVEDPARGVAGITMEVAAGGTLAARRAKTEHGWFEPHEIAEWTRQLCEALDYAHHTARIVHRDLKPGNLLLDAAGALKIADFGIAAALHESATRLTQGKVSGTPLYMSPEQWQGFPPTPSDDLYALGATLYDLLTGKPPFYSGNIMAAAMGRPPASMAERRRELEGIDAPLPPEWEEVVATLLAKTADERPASAKKVLTLLDGKVSSLTPQPAPKPKPAPAPAPVPEPPIADDQTLQGTPSAPPITGEDCYGWPWLRPILRRRWLAVLVWGALSTLTWLVIASAVGWRCLFNSGGGNMYGSSLNDGEILVSIATVGAATSWFPMLLLRPRWWGYPLWLLGSTVWTTFLLLNLEKISDWRYSSDKAMPMQSPWGLWLLFAALVSGLQATALVKVRSRLWLPGLATLIVLILQSCLGRLGAFHIYLSYPNDWENWLALQGFGSLAIAAAWFYGTHPISLRSRTEIAGEPGVEDASTLAPNPAQGLTQASESGGWPWLRPILRRRWLAVLVWGVASGFIWMGIGWICDFRAPFAPPASSANWGALPDAGGLFGTWRKDDACWTAGIYGAFAITWLPFLLLRPRWWGALGWFAASVGWMLFSAANLWNVRSRNWGDLIDPSIRSYPWLLGAVVALLVSAMQGAALWKVRTRWWVPAVATAVVLILQLTIESMAMRFIFLRSFADWAIWSTSQALGSLAIAAAWFYGTRPTAGTRTDPVSRVLSIS